MARTNPSRHLPRAAVTPQDLDIKLTEKIHNGQFSLDALFTAKERPIARSVFFSNGAIIGCYVENLAPNEAPGAARHCHELAVSEILPSYLEASGRSGRHEVTWAPQPLERGGSEVTLTEAQTAAVLEPLYLALGYERDPATGTLFKEYDFTK